MTSNNSLKELEGQIYEVREELSILLNSNERESYEEIRNKKLNPLLKEYKNLTGKDFIPHTQMNIIQEKKEITFIQNKEKEKEAITSKPEIIYETFNDDSLNCNQWVIEIHKVGEYTYYEGKKKFKEDFSAYHNIFNALMRLGEQKACVYALLNYLNNNIHMFNFVLWRANFEKLTGVKETTYREGINALFYYGILEATNRVKRNKKNICCKVYIFHIDLDINTLPSERFNPKNPEHMKIVKERKG